MDGVETIVDLNPEALAREGIRQGFVKREDYEAEVLRYYRLFIQGKNAEIHRLHKLLAKLT